MSVTVIGGGVMGLCVATELQGRGIPVAVRDEGPGPRACSWWTAVTARVFCAVTAVTTLAP